ncbi:hypothetical protein AGLY_010167 [Aphis glycines]|uniref:Uncharacterized protein n=1 Tax=Aphis glycines TaxID=307491 RepID=A0A6G0TFM2_APHGL|nr:hypothetical protein AGLY_010167 [Aphis glycines]
MLKENGCYTGIINKMVNNSASLGKIQSLTNRGCRFIYNHGYSLPYTNYVQMLNMQLYINFDLLQSAVTDVTVECYTLLLNHRTLTYTFFNFTKKKKMTCKKILINISSKFDKSEKQPRPGTSRVGSKRILDLNGTFGRYGFITLPKYYYGSVVKTTKYPRANIGYNFQSLSKMTRILQQFLNNYHLFRSVGILTLKKIR